MREPRSLRERYRMLVSLLIIPLGIIILVRAALLGWQAWTLILMGLAFVFLGCVRLRVYLQQQSNTKRGPLQEHTRK
jgi:hypothetical protein